jgi:hypothetical protein
VKEEHSHILTQILSKNMGHVVELARAKDTRAEQSEAGGVHMYALSYCQACTEHEACQGITRMLCLHIMLQCGAASGR